MKRALLITIGFPPEGGGGTIRAAKIAKYLPRYGWDLSVLTAKPPEGATAEALFDGVRVYRAPRFDITRSLVGTVGWIRKLVNKVRAVRLSVPLDTSSAGRTAESGLATSRRRLAEYIFIPDDRIVWVPLGFVLGLLAIMRDRPSVIYSTSPSPSTHLVGYCLATLTGLPWVIEFRDPWMLNPFRITRPFRRMEVLEGFLENKVLHKATHIVVTSGQYKKDFLRRYPLIPPHRVTYIPNGFDPEDFQGVCPKTFDLFTIVHTGTFYEARSSASFLEGVALALEKAPSLKGHFQVVFVGQRDPVTASAIDRLSLHNVVSQAGNVPHRISIEYLAGADVLLLIPGPGYGTMPGKTYEYLAVRKPILALAEEGAVSELMLSTGTGVVVQPEDISGIAEAILSMHKTLTSGNAVSHGQNVHDNILKQFDRREIARRIASLLDKTIEVQ